MFPRDRGGTLRESSVSHHTRHRNCRHAVIVIVAAQRCAAWDPNSFAEEAPTPRSLNQEGVRQIRAILSRNARYQNSLLSHLLRLRSRPFIICLARDCYWISYESATSVPEPIALGSVASRRSSKFFYHASS